MELKICEACDAEIGGDEEEGTLVIKYNGGEIEMLVCQKCFETLEHMEDLFSGLRNESI